MDKDNFEKKIIKKKKIWKKMIVILEKKMRNLKKKWKSVF